MIRRGYPSLSGVLDYLMGYSFVPLILSCAYVIRGCGRYANPDYHIFLDAYNRSRAVTGKFRHEEALSTGLADVDFAFSHYPICFTHKESTIRPRVLSSERPLTFFERVQKIPFSVLNYISARVVARRLVYPGSISLIQMAMNQPLSEGREQLLKKFNGRRAKLVAVDGNHIDTMFVDRRSSSSSHKGHKLVISCEGNAAFYEVQGAMGPPLQAGYSVLGWNHPGFAGSSGLPFPSQEGNAIDVVVRYAVTELNFELEDIILYAWSIGGFTASWAAMSYPKIGAVVLDATFDEIQPLAVRQVPDWLKSLTKDMIKEHFELNIAEQISHYPGPVYLVRRVNDEMITTRPADPTSNRINNLLVKILQYRYPVLFSPESSQVLWQWVYSFTTGDKNGIFRDKGVDSNWCNVTLVLHVSENGSSYPSTIGAGLTPQQKTQLLLYLAGKYMEDYTSTHCTPLPLSLFKVPLPGNLAYEV
jgi:hypothetical protein